MATSLSVIVPKSAEGDQQQKGVLAADLALDEDELRLLIGPLHVRLRAVVLDFVGT